MNYLHDYFYDYGFDEAAGNAQQDNYGRVPLDMTLDTDGDPTNNDPIIAKSQEASAVNNASMYTPSDGNSPEMNMHLYSLTIAAVTSHPSIGQLFYVLPATFGLLQYADVAGEGTI